ncbi:hypothetical protein DOTSEDRAFT_53626 [Dothistroma septosporum NZE10]|uniref:Uncharacterized protein n=1 Tax=Dothistroma septosporum (strain NZE10 / CBS 128990) TaxID=675120 RepID=N1PQA7_DOTSN|nr:hypothetical protein DOTSEDRAFT_53626 [Dothistroma septosporum NZE10]
MSRGIRMNPLNIDFMLAVLSRLDSKLGGYRTDSEQRAFFKDLLATKPLYFSRNRALSKRDSSDREPHDVNSCLEKLQRMARDKVDAGEYTSRVMRVFAEGSACLPSKFLEAVGYSKNGDATPSGSQKLMSTAQDDGDNSSQSDPVIKTKGATAISDSAEETSEDEADQDDTCVDGAHPSRKRKAASTAAERPETKRQKTAAAPEKRPGNFASEPDITAVDPAKRLDEAGRGTKVSLPSTKERNNAHFDEDQESGETYDRKYKSPKLTNSAPNPDKQQPPAQAVGAAKPRDPDTLYQDAQMKPATSSDEHPVAANVNTGSHKSYVAVRGECGFRNKIDVEAHLDRDIYHQSSKAQAPKLRWLAGDILAISGDDVESMYNGLISAIEDTSGHLYSDIEHKKYGGLYPAYPTNIEPKPTNALRELYALILGHGWPKYSSGLVAEGGVDMQTLVEALIGAFLTLKVFRKRLPWNSPMDCLVDPSFTSTNKYVRQCCEEKSADYDKLMHEAAFKQIKDKSFQEGKVMEAAEVLTTEFTHAIMDQITLFRKSRTPTDGWYTRFWNNVRRVSFRALILRGHFEASKDTWNTYWPSEEAPFKKDDMTMPDGSYGSDGIPILFTIFPAICLQEHGEIQFLGETACRALVRLADKDITGTSCR